MFYAKKIKTVVLEVWTFERQYYVPISETKAPTVAEKNQRSQYWFKWFQREQ